MLPCQRAAAAIHGRIGNVMGTRAHDDAAGASMRTRSHRRFRCYPESDRGTVATRWELADHASGPLRRLVESRREQVMAIAARHHASRVRLFGSAARGDERPDSDIDLLVDFAEDSSLFDLMRMSRELESLLGRPVDVVWPAG